MKDTKNFLYAKHEELGLEFAILKDFSAVYCEDKTVYSHEEIKYLINNKIALTKEMHLTKKEFGGTICGDKA